jgi:hypothetical protein
MRREEMFVRPLREIMHINKKTLSGGTLPATLEGGIQVLLLAVVTQRQLDPREDYLLIPGRTIEVPK